MREFHTKAIINAPVAVVWRTITDADAYPRFDPNCVKIDGDITTGKYISIHSKLMPKRNFKVLVSQMKPNELMVWESGLPFNLFKGVRTFMVSAKDDQTTEFHMVLVFSGHLFGLFDKMIPDMSEAFLQFSKGLKHYIESRP